MEENTEDIYVTHKRHVTGNEGQFKADDQIKYYIDKFLEWITKEGEINRPLFPVPLFYGDSILIKINDKKIVISDLKNTSDFSNAKLSFLNTAGTLEKIFNYDVEGMEVELSINESLFDNIIGMNKLDYWKEKIETELKEKNIKFFGISKSKLYNEIIDKKTFKLATKLIIGENIPSKRKRLFNDFLDKYLYGVFFYNFAYFHSCIILEKFNQNDETSFSLFQEETLKLVKDNFKFIFEQKEIKKDLKTSFNLYEKTIELKDKVKKFINDNLSDNLKREEREFFEETKKEIIDFIIKNWDPCNQDPSYKVMKYSCSFIKKRKNYEKNDLIIKNILSLIYKYISDNILEEEE